LALRSFGIDEGELFDRMTYWQSKGYVRAVFPAMARFARFKAGSVVSEMFPGKGGEDEAGQGSTVDEMVEMGLFGRGEG